LPVLCRALGLQHGPFGHVHSSLVVEPILLIDRDSSFDLVKDFQQQAKGWKTHWQCQWHTRDGVE
jgi:hypothetical protein